MRRQRLGHGSVPGHPPLAGHRRSPPHPWHVLEAQLAWGRDRAPGAGWGLHGVRSHLGFRVWKPPSREGSGAAATASAGGEHKAEVRRAGPGLQDPRKHVSGA